MEKKRAFLKRSYKPSPEKIKQACVFPAEKPTTASKFGNRSKENLFNSSQRSGMGCQRIDKEAVFEELQHVKCEILEVQNRNEALWEENSLLEKQLARVQYQQSKNISEKVCTSQKQNLVKNTLTREIQQLKQKSELQMQELEKLKRSPKYTTYLELEVEKKVLEDRLAQLQERIKEGRADKQARRKYNKQLSKKIEERDELLLRMKEGVQRENAKLQQALKSLIDENSHSEARLRELQTRNARYRNEIDRLKDEAKARQILQKPSASLELLTKALTVRWIKLGIPLHTVLTALSTILKPSDNLGSVIGENVCKEIRNVLKSSEELERFVQQIDKNWASIKTKIQAVTPLTPSMRQVLKNQLLESSINPYISLEALHKMLQQLGISNEAVLLRLFKADALGEESFKKLERTKLAQFLQNIDRPSVTQEHTAEVSIRPASSQKERPLSSGNKRGEILGSAREDKDDSDDDYEMDKEWANEGEKESDDDLKAYEEEFEKQDDSENKDEYNDSFEEEPLKPPSRQLCVSEFDEATTRKKFSKESKEESSVAYSEVIGSRPVEPSIKVIESLKAMGEIKEVVVVSYKNEEYYRKLHQESAKSLSQCINTSAKNIQQRIEQDHSMAELIQRELQTAQQSIIENRIYGIRKISQKILSKQQLEMIEQIPQDEITSEVEFQASLEAKVMLEALYDKLLDQQVNKRNRFSSERLQARNFLETIYEETQERLEELQQNCSDDHNIRDFVGELYRKVTNIATCRESISDSFEGDEEGRDSKFIEDYLNAFRKNFTFI